MNDKVVVVHHAGPRCDCKGVAFSIASNSGSAWNWQSYGLLAIPPAYGFCFDPTIAYNAITGDFVASVALTQGPTPGYKLGVAHYFPTTNGPFGDGVSLIDPNLYGGPLASADKPTIVAGEMTSSIQEFYIVATRVGQPNYLRSTDGGYTWPYWGAIDGTGGVSFVTPCTSTDGKIFVAESGPSTTAFKFFQGTDITNPADPNFGKVSWGPLETDAVDPPDPLVVPLNASTATRYLPLPSNHWDVRMWPKIAADPLDPNVLYVAYHDLAAAPNGRPDEDMDVYLRRLTRNPSTGYWTASGRVKVNDDNPDPNTIIDEFLPEIWVTREPGQPTHVHVVFFTDRHFPGQIDNNPEYPKFDVYYARSENGGAGFPSDFQKRLHKYSTDANNDIPMIDYAKLPGDSCENKPYELNDYFGFTARMTSGGFGFGRCHLQAMARSTLAMTRSSLPARSSRR